MGKYIAIFKISFAQEFAYRINFIMWRIRNVFQILITFFLWDSVFSESGRQVFGYDKTGMFTYIFALMIVRAFVLSARAVDVSSDVAQGNLSNNLLKPVGYFKYWVTRDIASKALNLSFAVVEFGALFLILRPEFYLPQSPVVFLLFLLSLIFAAALYFFLLFIISAVPFWAPELGWGAHFLMTIVLIEFLSGMLFPLDILPDFLHKMLLLLPFPYMIFFPIQVYLGKITGPEMVQGFAASLVWIVLLYFFMKNIWARGLKVYQAFGR